MKQISLNEAAELCGNYGMPLAVSVNGADKLYLMTERMFQNYANALEFAEVMEGIADIENVNYTDGDDFEKEMREKYGL